MTPLSFNTRKTLIYSFSSPEVVSAWWFRTIRKQLHGMLRCLVLASSFLVTNKTCSNVMWLFLLFFFLKKSLITSHCWFEIVKNWWSDIVLFIAGTINSLKNMMTLEIDMRAPLTQRSFPWTSGWIWWCFFWIKIIKYLQFLLLCCCNSHCFFDNETFVSPFHSKIMNFIFQILFLESYHLFIISN